MDESVTSTFATTTFSGGETPMKCMNRIAGRSALALAGLVIMGSVVAAGDTLQVKSGEVSVICPLTVGGSFEAKTDVVKGEVTVAGPAQPLNGALHVDLQSLETGIGLRDRHMKNNYLEVEKGTEYAAARLEDMLTLHGARKEVTGSAQIKPTSNGYRVEATFPLRTAEFGIPDPTYLGVGVKDELQVRVNFVAARSVTATVARATSNGGGR
jgi:polyisoprenoid-binding protein YceI